MSQPKVSGSHTADSRHSADATPTVSVVIPNFNYLRFLPSRIESVLSQTFTDFELILLDDASTDGSAEYLRGFDGHPKVSRVIINDVNTGSPFRQWARGVDAARGRYVWIAEADDLAEPTFLERTVGLMEAHPQMTLAMTMSELIDAEGKPGCRKYFEDFDPDGASVVYDGREVVAQRMFHNNSCYNASMVLFSREAWQRLPDREFLEMRYCGDWRLWSQLMLMGQVGLVRSRLNSFRFHGHSVTDEGAANGRCGFEGHMVQLYLTSQPGVFHGDQRMMTLYRIWRDFRGYQRRRSRRYLYAQHINPTMLDGLGLHGRYKWAAMWSYAHLVHWATDILCARKLKPLWKYDEQNAPRS